MKEIKKPAEGLSTAKAVLGIILSIAILAIAQSLAFVISEFLLNLGVPGAICNVIAGVLYVALALAGITLLCKKILKVDIVLRMHILLYLEEKRSGRREYGKKL